VKTLIVTGGNSNIEFTKEYFLKYSFDLIIAVDKGLEILDKLNINPDYIVGDFDSIDKSVFKKYENGKFEIIKLNPIKDLTDTNEGINLAIEKGSDEIYVLGGIGSRIDHTIGNIHVLKEALDKDVICRIIDKNNEIELINKRTILDIDSNFKYISLIPLTTKVTGVTLKGFKYEIENYDLEIGKSLGISNEQIENIATIDLKEGILILIKSKD
jgi:thiamine pyrophosphokinase